MEVIVLDSWRKAMALKKLLELSEADVEAGRLWSSEEAFARMSRVIDTTSVRQVVTKRDRRKKK